MAIIAPTASAPRLTAKVATKGPMIGPRAITSPTRRAVSADRHSRAAATSAIADACTAFSLARHIARTRSISASAKERTFWSMFRNRSPSPGSGAASSSGTVSNGASSVRGSGGATVSVLVIAAATAQQPRQDETDGSRRAHGNHRTFTDELPGAFGKLGQVLLAQGNGGAGTRIPGPAGHLAHILHPPPAQTPK